MGIEKRDLSWLASEEAPQWDVFLCCASYEERCLSVAERIRCSALRKALIGEYAASEAHLDKNRLPLRELFGNVAEVVPMEGAKPLATADAWGKALAGISRDVPHRFLCDVTTFTHESLLVLLKLLALCAAPNDTFEFAYTSAQEYDPPRTGRDKWLSKGVADVRSVLGYAGIIRPSSKTHLIILVGYEHERATRLIQAFEPNRVSLGCGSVGSATDEKHHSANTQFHALASEMAARYAPVERFEFPSNDPWGAKESILAQARRFEGYNVVVAPMNTKISTVGCALAAWEEKSIQLCYAQAARYNYAHYSTPGDTCYIFDLPELASARDDKGQAGQP